MTYQLLYPCTAHGRIVTVFLMCFINVFYYYDYYSLPVVFPDNLPMENKIRFHYINKQKRQFSPHLL